MSSKRAANSPNKWQKVQRSESEDNLYESLAVMRGWVNRKQSNLKPGIYQLADETWGWYIWRISQPDINSALWACVTGKRFQRLSFLMIMLNTIFLGWRIDHASNDKDAGAESDALSNHVMFDVVQLVFTVHFSAEVLFRLVVERVHFFTSEDLAWNLFDLSVCSATVMEAIIASILSAHASGLPSVVLVRVVRMVRVIRILKVIQMAKMFSELRLMVQQLLCSLKMLCWAMVLVFMVAVMVAMIMAQGVTDMVLMSGHTKEGLEAGDLSKFRLQETWGGVATSMITLFKAVTGGEDWGPIYDSLGEVGFFYKQIFLAYVTFMLFAVMNIVTAVFVEHAVKAAALDSDHVLKQAIDNEDRFIEEMEGLFLSADDDESGTITKDELQEFLGNKKVRARLKLLGLEVHEAVGLFSLLDTEDKGHLTVQEFVLGCLRLRGGARSVDTATIMTENKRVVKVMSRNMQLLMREVSLIQRQLTLTNEIAQRGEGRCTPRPNVLALVPSPAASASKGPLEAAPVAVEAPEDEAAQASDLVLPLTAGGIQSSEFA